MKVGVEFCQEVDQFLLFRPNVVSIVSILLDKTSLDETTLDKM
jgi:hypothetical protein